MVRDFSSAQREGGRGGCQSAQVGTTDLCVPQFGTYKGKSYLWVRTLSQ